MKKIIIVTLFVLISSTMFAQSMKIWKGGECQEVNISDVDSITFVENTTPGTGGGGNEDTSNNVIVADGISYKINAVHYYAKDPEHHIQYIDSTTGTNVEIETLDEYGEDGGPSFPSSLSDVYCKIELRIGGHNSGAVAATIKCAKNGNTYQCVISNLNVKGHTLSLSFNDDITKYPNE